MEVINFTWKDFDKAVDELVKKISPRPTSVFGIPRGGLVLAVALSHRLGIPLCEDDHTNTLIVDDISDTGRTLKVYQEWGYKIATIHYVQSSSVKPDFWVVEKIRGDWIRYPWEVK